MEEFADMNVLLQQLSPGVGAIDPVLVTKVIRCSSLVLAQDDLTRRVVGMATLCPVAKVRSLEGHIEDVVVLDSHRGQGIGKGLLLEMLTVAKEMNITSLHLTTRPSREAANGLYRSLGFQLRETNVYKLDL